MAEIDNLAKKFISDNARFAELFNYFIYDSEPVISPDDLKPAETEEIVLPYANGKKGHIQRYRDTLKLWAVKQDGHALYVLLGGEAQDKIHYAMPVKNMLYDASNYSTQVEARARFYRNQAEKEPVTDGEFLSGFHKEDKLIPVITLVISLREGEWDGPKSIHEMFGNYDDRLLKLVPDYRINLISPGMISDEALDKMMPDVDAVFRFIKYSGDKEKILEMFTNNPKFESIDHYSVDLINAVTGSGIKYKTKKGKVNMCTAMQEIRQDSFSQGISQGIEQGIEQGQFQTLVNLTEKRYITIEQAAEEAGMSVEEFLEKMKVM